MSKDSQVDSKEIRNAKANGNRNTLASEEVKNKSRTHKKQSAKKGLDL